MYLPPDRSLGNSKLARAIRIETSFAVRLHQRVSHRRAGTMLHGEWNDRIVLSLESLAMIELANLDGKRESVDAELLRAFQVTSRALRSPETQRIRASLKPQRRHPPDHPPHPLRARVRDDNNAQ